MGLSFRRSLKMGPLRVNLSGAGVGISAGVRGARVSVGPRGTYVTLSAGGFRYQRKLDSTARTALPAMPRSQAVAPVAAPAEAGFIATASVGTLIESSPEDSLEEIQRRVHRLSWFLVYLLLSAPLLVYVLSLELPWLLLLAGVVLGAGALWIYLWDRERRTARLIYDVDSPELLERFSLCNAAGEALSRAARRWHIYYSVRTQDQKRNAGATSLIRRTRVPCVPRPLPLIDCNVQPWSIPAGPQQLLFLPDRLLVHEGRRIAAVPYTQLAVEARTSQFIEEESVPSDATVVGSTWRFVNKSGGPDRRFKNNRQLPILSYGEVSLRSPSGMHIVIQCSTAEAADATKRALDELCRLSRADMSEPPLRVAPVLADAPAEIPAREAVPITLPLPSPEQTQAAGRASKALAAVTVLRYIAVADRRFTAEEKQRLDAAAREFCARDQLAEAALLAQLPDLRTDATKVTEALELLRSAEPELRRRVLTLATDMAATDGNVTPKEKERLAEISTALAQ